jgi:hypothetical protein
MASRRTRWKPAPYNGADARARYDAMQAAQPVPAELWTTAVYVCEVHGEVRATHIGEARTTCQKCLPDLTGVALSHCNVPCTSVRIEKQWLR